MTSFDIHYVISLYHGYQAIAERVEMELLKQIHLSTDLDKKILEWLQSGWDVILTGNPGDGKTHLLRFLDLPESVERETDASQKQSHELLNQWRTARQAGKRFILAINH